MMNLKQIANVDFPTCWAHFQLLGFEAGAAQNGLPQNAPQTALALVLGNIRSGDPVVRIHSQCTTGDVFHSLRCDCHDQLHLALRVIAKERSGILIYEHQEGRGIGLMEKLRAYELQEHGLDTLDANLQLGHPVDARNYELPVQILRHLGVSSLRLLTNNPAKVSAVLAAGIDIAERLSADVPIHPHSAHYVNTKREKLGHFYEPTLS